MPPSVPLHGRDHCLGGADPLPCLPNAWGYAYFTVDQTFVADGDQQLTWDVVTVKAGQTDITVGPFGTTPFMANTEGFYSVTFWHQWTTAFSNQHFGHIDSSGTALPTNPIYGASMGALDQAQVVTVPNWYIGESVPDGISFYIYKASGSGSRTLTQGGALITYLGKGHIPQ